MIITLILGHLMLLVTKATATPEIPTPIQAFNGYNYPKPSIPFNPGYVYSTPSCPLNIPITSYVTIPVTKTSIVMTTLPPVTSTEFVTLPRLTEYLTEIQVQTLTSTSTDYLTSTTTEFQIQPTTITSYITSSYCAPSTYLPPVPPKNTYLPAATVPPPTPSNVYLPVNQQRQQQPQYLNVEQTTPNSFLQSFGFAQAGPIKRMANEIEANSLEEPLGQNIDQSSTSIAAPPTASGTLPPSPPPAINIIYLDRSESVGGSGGNANAPPADLMNWLLCRFNLVNKTCLN